MRYFFIMNPGSRGGSSKKRFGKIFDFLDTCEVQYSYKITRSLDEAYNLSVEGNKAGYDVIVAVGGDGTINRVLNGFFDEKGNRISNARMGVIYTGTSPDFCKSYNIPVNTGEALRSLLNNKSATVQIGRIRLTKEFDGSAGNRFESREDNYITRYFACCANIGIGAALARRANGGIRKYFGDTLGTFLALIRTLVSFRPGAYTLNCDGKVSTFERVHSISIGRTFYIASGIKVKNDLKQGDGLFYMMTVKDMGLKNVLSIMKKAYSGKKIEDDGVMSLEYVKTIDVYSDGLNTEVEFDGDPAGYLPCKIEIAQDGLELVCDGVKTYPPTPSFAFNR